jgi:LDH2 family malate/lactate/ureidoglycolate dehydrogenase
VDTHGLWHLAGYVAAIRRGELLPAASPAILKEGPTSALITGNWTFGQAAAKFAMETAIAKAAEHGVAVVGVVQAHHVGRLGHFVEMAARRQMISMVWAGGYGEEQPAAVPYGGRERLLHTNPIAMGFPANEEPPMMIDYATTHLSGVKVVNAQRRHERLPAGCIVDKAGNPTTDPNDFSEGGGHLPFGGHKGYALMMAAEYLGRIFTGADAFAEADRGGPILRHQGVTMMVLQAALFQPFAEYACRADEMERRVRAVPPAPGFSEVLVPGDPESRTRASRQRDGIPIHEDVWRSIVEVAASLNVEVA